MYPSKSTPVPNFILDKQLPYLNQAQLKVLLVIIRQTLGWYDHKHKRRKDKDWIALSFFRTRTGLSNKSISSALNELRRKELILILNAQGKELKHPKDRRGKKRIYYAYAPYYRSLHDRTWAQRLSDLCTFRRITKETPTKEKRRKERPKIGQRKSDSERISEIKKGLRKKKQSRGYPEYPDRLH